MFRAVPRTRLALAVLLAAAAAGTLATSASALNVEIVNKSSQQPSNIYVMLHNGSSTDHQLPNNVPKQLSAITNSTFSLGRIVAGRLFFSYGSPVNSAEPPQVPIRYDKVEFTNPGQANLTAVDFFGIPLDMQTLNSAGTVLETLSFRCHTSTITKNLLTIPGAGSAQVNTTSGQFARILSPQLSPSSYPSMAPYIATMANKKITVDSKFFGTPFQVANYTGTFGADGTITLTGTIRTPSTKRTVPGLPLRIEGSSLPSAIYSGNGPYTVNGKPRHVSDNDVYAVIYRDVVAGFALGYWGGKYGNDSADWKNEAPFAKARTAPGPFTAFNRYAATIQEYSDAYGFSFSDVGPSPVQATLNSSVATMRITIDSDQGPQTPGCVGASTPSMPSPPPIPSPPPGSSGRVDASINSSTATLNRHGRVVLRLTCQGDPCKGVLTLSEERVSKRTQRSARRKKRGRKKLLLLGRANFAIPEGETQRVRVRIRKRGRRAINKTRRRGLNALVKTLVGPRSRPTTVAKRRVRLNGYKWRRKRR